MPQMTQSDAARIMSAQGGQIQKGSFAARAQSAGDRNANANAQQSAGFPARAQAAAGGRVAVSAQAGAVAAPKGGNYGGSKSQR